MSGVRVLCTFQEIDENSFKATYPIHFGFNILWQIRDILVDVINQAVDQSLDKAKKKKKQDITL